jgi:hypothetical protein
VYEALVEAAAADLDLGNQAMAGIDEQGQEVLLAAAAKTYTEVLVDLLRRAQPLSDAERTSKAARSEAILAGPMPGITASSASPACSSRSSTPKRSSSSPAVRAAGAVAEPVPSIRDSSSAAERA